MSEAEVWTVRRLLEWTTGFFKNHGCSSPRLEAEVLLAHALDVTRIELYTLFDTVPEGEKLAIFRSQVKRRAAGEPVAYLVGHKEFYSLDFCVTADTLIPRPETEQLVLEGIEYFRSKRKKGESGPFLALDLGTGSGCIAVALAKNCAELNVLAVDCSENALKVARSNAEKHGVAERVEFRCSDLFEQVPDEKTLDLLVSNPPYIKRAEYDALEGTVRNYEPRGALLAGERGTEIVEKIVELGPKRVKSGGKVLIEICPSIADATLELAEKSGYFAEIALLADFAGLKRTVSATVR